MVQSAETSSLYDFKLRRGWGRQLESELLFKFRYLQNSAFYFLTFKKADCIIFTCLVSCRLSTSRLIFLLQIFLSLSFSIFLLFNGPNIFHPLIFSSFHLSVLHSKDQKMNTSFALVTWAFIWTIDGMDISRFLRFQKGPSRICFFFVSAQSRICKMSPVASVLVAQIFQQNFYGYDRVPHWQHVDGWKQMKSWCSLPWWRDHERGALGFSQRALARENCAVKRLRPLVGAPSCTFYSCFMVDNNWMFQRRGAANRVCVTLL